MQNGIPYCRFKRGSLGGFWILQAAAHASGGWGQAKWWGLPWTGESCDPGSIWTWTKSDRLKQLVGVGQHTDPPVNPPGGDFLFFESLLVHNVMRCCDWSIRLLHNSDMLFITHRSYIHKLYADIFSYVSEEFIAVWLPLIYHVGQTGHAPMVFGLLCCCAGGQCLVVLQLGTEFGGHHLRLGNLQGLHQQGAEQNAVLASKAWRLTTSCII